MTIPFSLFSFFLQIHIQALNVRVSYNDAMLFLAIINSLPAQILQKDDEDEPMEVEKQQAVAKGKDANTEKFKKRQGEMTWRYTDFHKQSRKFAVSQICLYLVSFCKYPSAFHSNLFSKFCLCYSFQTARAWFQQT